MSLFRHDRLAIAALVALLALGPIVGDACAASPKAPAGSSVSLFTRIRAQAGGWGLLTPALELVTRVVEASQMKGVDSRTRFAHVTRFATSKKFWGGVAGDLVFTSLAEALTGSMPGGVFLRTTLVCLAGFAGYELGSGNIKETDWGDLILQSVAISAVYCAVSALSLPCAGLLATAAAFITGMILDHFSGDKIEDGHGDEVEAGGDAAPTVPTIVGPQGARAGSGDTGGSDLASLQARSQTAYQELVAKMRSEPSGPGAQAALVKYQQCQDALRKAKASAAGGY
ncbi:MAG: hypothetical protein HY815_00430 [Candidatus Riflebacteria bacterium]|nr:hypothetical protein [Candidatus Riflebacteria bacterium]